MAIAKKKATPAQPMVNLGALQEEILLAAQALRDAKEDRDNALIAHQEAFRKLNSLSQQMQNGLNQLNNATVVHDSALE